MFICVHTSRFPISVTSFILKAKRNTIVIIMSFLLFVFNFKSKMVVQFFDNRSSWLQKFWESFINHFTFLHIENINETVDFILKFFLQCLGFFPTALWKYNRIKRNKMMVRGAILFLLYSRYPFIFIRISGPVYFLFSLFGYIVLYLMRSH